MLCGERAGTRTQDLLIKSQLLYRLSYALSPGQGAQASDGRSQGSDAAGERGRLRCPRCVGAPPGPVNSRFGLWLAPGASFATVAAVRPGNGLRTSPNAARPGVAR